jgi:hypothetical protein
MWLKAIITSWSAVIFNIIHVTGEIASTTAMNRLPGKDLKQIIKELEESDYGGYGSWGNFRIRREYRDKKLNSKFHGNEPRDYSIAVMNDDPNLPSSSTNNHQLVRASGNTVDYYKPHSSSELIMLLERANILKDPRKKFSASKIIRFSSFFKVSILIITISVVSYLSVIPRIQDFELYNQAYKENLTRVAISFMYPLLLLLGVFRHRDADINILISTFFTSFMIYYPLIALIEKAFATFVRLLILK